MPKDEGLPVRIISRTNPVMIINFSRNL